MLQNKVAKGIEGVQNTKLSAADLSSLIDGHMSYFNELHTSGKENELYMKGENLQKKKKNDYTKQQRSHFPIPTVHDKLSRIEGSERNSRTYAKAEALKPDSEILAELITLRFRTIEKQSNMEYVESEIFKSGIGAKYGIGEWIVEYDAIGNPKIKFVKRDYLDTIWDSNAREYDKSDGAFFGHRMKAYRIDIERDYGEEIARSIEINPTTFGRKANQNWGITAVNGKRDFDIIYIYRIFVKVLRPTFHVVFGLEDFVCYSQQEADEKERMLKLPYILSGQPIPPSDVVPVTEYKYDYYETTLNEILKYEQTELDAYPFCVYQAYQFEDSIICLTDILKPLNKMIDKLISQIDFAIGSDIKNGWELVTSWLAEGITFQDAIRKVKAGEPLPVIRPGALRGIPFKGANPQWMEMLGILDSFADKYTGGDLYSGVQKGRQRESTQSVQIKLRQQELIAGVFIDNLRRWKRSVFQKGLWYLKKHDTQEIIQKVHGSSITPEMMKLLQQNKIYTPSTQYGVGYVRMNNPENELTILKNADVDIYIVEENVSDTYKDAKYQKMMLEQQTNPDLILSPTWLRKKFEQMDFTYEEREKIIQEISQAKSQQAQEAQQERTEMKNMEKAKILISDKGPIKQLLTGPNGKRKRNQNSN